MNVPWEPPKLQDLLIFLKDHLPCNETVARPSARLQQPSHPRLHPDRKGKHSTQRLLKVKYKIEHTAVSSTGDSWVR